MTSAFFFVKMCPMHMLYTETRFMKKIWGIPVRNMWRLEDGGLFEPDDLHPVVVKTPIGEHVLGIPKDNEHEAVIVQSYYPPSRPNSAQDFARMVWKTHQEWTRPNLEQKVISCLGAPACDACMGEALPAIDLASRWRLNSYILSDKLTAGRLLDPTDTESDMTIDEHVFAEITDETDMTRLNAELTRRAVALFGPAYDVHTGVIYPAYSRVYERNEC